MQKNMQKKDAKKKTNFQTCKRQYEFVQVKKILKLDNI